jgi:hypothetical protein
MNEAISDERVRAARGQVANERARMAERSADAVTREERLGALEDAARESRQRAWSDY